LRPTWGGALSAARPQAHGTASGHPPRAGTRHRGSLPASRSPHRTRRSARGGLGERRGEQGGDFLPRPIGLDGQVPPAQGELLAPQFHHPGPAQPRQDGVPRPKHVDLWLALPAPQRRMARAGLIGSDGIRRITGRAVEGRPLLRPRAIMPPERIGTTGHHCSLLRCGEGAPGRRRQAHAEAQVPTALGPEHLIQEHNRLTEEEPAEECQGQGESVR
jgi:hypothetical protein